MSHLGSAARTLALTVLVWTPGCKASSRPAPAPDDSARRMTYCQAFAEGNARENCFMRIAAEAKNAVLCANAGSIQAECLTAVARATSSSAPCVVLAEPRDAFDCVMAAAIHAKNADVCTPLFDIVARETTCTNGGVAKGACGIWRSEAGARAGRACKAAATGDARACEGLPAWQDGGREACLHHLAVRNKAAAACSGLHREADPQRNLKENACLADVGVSSKSAADCELIPHGKANPVGDLDYEVCLMAAASKDASTCTRLPSDGNKEHDEISRRLCVAVAGTPCPETGVADCLVHWQMSLTDTTLCEGSPWGRDNDGCGLTVAMNTRNTKACDGILDAAMKSACTKLTAP
jgi:hypothetical protein